MHAIYRGLDESKAVMPRVHVQEIGADRSACIIANAEPKQITVERKCGRHILYRDQHVAHAEWAGAEAGDGAARPERFVGDLRAVERLQPVAGRIGERDQAGYEALIEKLGPLVRQGLAAAVYTQTTDVEGEVNGLMTYDRKVIKYDAAKLAALHRALIQSVSQ